MNGQVRISHQGFTLVETLVTISVIGMLITMTLPAIQALRESARKISCQNNLRQIGLALNNFESAHQIYPPGSLLGTQFSWAATCLPFLEQAPLHECFDFAGAWNSPHNYPSALIVLTAFRCPSSSKDYPGLTDYSGIAGSWLSTSPSLSGERNGMLFEPVPPSDVPVRVAEVFDGLSQTIMVAESALLLEDQQGWWACGGNCISHDDGRVNNPDGHATEIASFHVGGANAVSADGAVKFLTNQMEPSVVGAYCTRSQGDFVFE